MAPGGMIAALFVDARGAYAKVPGVELWDRERDARHYAGPWPIVAHPPCQRWGILYAGNPSVISATGSRFELGDDGGCFEAALGALRRWGGVLEHPWRSQTWPVFGLNTPPRGGGWIMADWEGLWTCCVEQGRYGHYARKPTLLLVSGIDAPPSLAWGVRRWEPRRAEIERLGFDRAKKRGEVARVGGGRDSRKRIGTPPPFRDLLLSLARSARPELARQLEFAL